MSRTDCGRHSPITDPQKKYATIEKTNLFPLSTSWKLRGVAMLMILFVHSLNEYPEAMHQFWAHGLLVPHWGIIGSAIFLLLSGYGMLCSLQRRGTDFDARYWLRKAKGLMLPYCAAFAVTALTLTLYDAKFEGGYTFDASELLRFNLADGNELWFFKTIVAEYLLLMLFNLMQLSARTQVFAMTAIHVGAVALMCGCGLPRYWWASDIFFALGMAMALVPVRKKAGSTMTIRLPWMHYASRALAYIGRNSICFYLLEIPVMWTLPSSELPWPLFFLLTVALTTLLTELYRRTFGRL